MDMKNFICFLFLVVATFILPASEFRGGVFCVDNSVECRNIQIDGTTTTNTIFMGKTVEMGESMLEIDTLNKTTFYFSGGPLIEVGTNSTLSINLFDRVVLNPNSIPRKAEFGGCNLSVKFDVGEYCVIYPNSDPNSSFTITTPYTAYEILNGKFYFRITDRSAIVYVIEGTMNVHGDKHINKTAKGNLAIAVPFVDPASGLNDKIVTSIKPVNQEDTSKFSDPVIQAEQKWNDVRFFIIEGKIIGVWGN